MQNMNPEFKPFLVALAVVWSLFLAMFAEAQSTIPPNRKDAVAAILAGCPQAFEPPVTDAKRRRVIPFVVAELNAIDGAGKWALLYRMDREDDDPAPGRLTADVVVWTRTKEHFDVLTDRGPTWIAHGMITDPDWQMRDPSGFPTLCVDLEPLKRLIADLQRQAAELAARLEAETTERVSRDTGLEQEIEEGRQVDALQRWQIELLHARPNWTDCHTRIPWLGCGLDATPPDPLPTELLPE